MRINPRKNSLKHTIIKKNTYLEKHLKLQKIHIPADRQKEQFSDGVGYGWIDQLKHTATLSN
jgi:hypothetical protein